MAIGQGADDHVTEGIMKALSKSTRMASGVSGLAFLIATQLAPAHGTPTIVQGNYEEIVQQSCSNVGTCTVNFTPVPAGKLLVVTNTSCLIQGSSGLSVFWLASVPGYGEAPVYLTPTAMPGGSIQGGATSISKAYPAGAIPNIMAQYTVKPKVTLYCSIFGTITP
jgi:hypothetical protein